MKKSPADEHRPDDTRKPTEITRTARQGFDALCATLRQHPWMGMAGGVAAGALVAYFATPRRPEPTALDTVRGLLHDAKAKLPTQKEAGRAAARFSKWLHLPA